MWLFVCLFIYLLASASVCLILAIALTDFTLVLRTNPKYLATSFGNTYSQLYWNITLILRGNMSSKSSDGMTLLHYKYNACDRLRICLICWVITSPLLLRLIIIVLAQNVNNGHCTIHSYCRKVIRFLCVLLGLKDVLCEGIIFRNVEEKRETLPSANYLCRAIMMNNQIV